MACLPVEDVEYDHSVEETGDISNMTPEQYLAWVRDQASKLPAVLKVKVSRYQFILILSLNSRH